jgi:hypothetical protein
MTVIDTYQSLRDLFRRGYHLAGSIKQKRPTLALSREAKSINHSLGKFPGRQLSELFDFPKGGDYYLGEIRACIPMTRDVLAVFEERLRKDAMSGTWLESPEVSLSFLGLLNNLTYYVNCTHSHPAIAKWLEKLEADTQADELTKSLEDIPNSKLREYVSELVTLRRDQGRVPRGAKRKLADRIYKDSPSKARNLERYGRKYRHLYE